MTNFADRTIWTGDNLDILRGLNSTSVDLIYLDTPFNSNRNYAAPVGSSAAGAAYKDTWTLSDLDVAWMGLIADEQPAMYQVLQAAGLTQSQIDEARADPDDLPDLTGVLDSVTGLLLRWNGRPL